MILLASWHEHDVVGLRTAVACDDCGRQPLLWWLRTLEA